MTDTLLDRAGVKAKFDVFPEQIVGYLALIGDNIDNIPGVPKVGPKTAAKWLNEYATLDNLIANAANVPGKVGDSLREHLTTLELSRKLATIDCDLKLDVSSADLAPRPPDNERLRDIYTRLELKSLLRQIPSSEAPSPEPVTVPPTPTVPATPTVSPQPAALARRYETVVTQEDLDRWLEILRTAPLFAFDTETTSLEYMAPTATAPTPSGRTSPGRASDTSFNS